MVRFAHPQFLPRLKSQVSLRGVYEDEKTARIHNLVFSPWLIAEELVIDPDTRARLLEGYLNLKTFLDNTAKLVLFQDAPDFGVSYEALVGYQNISSHRIMGGVF
jgi:hypothetical protein